MRTVIALGVAASLLALPAVAGEIDRATLEQIRAAAAAGYDNPQAAQIQNVYKSKAPGGRGYCGDVTIEEMPESFTSFHVILPKAGEEPQLIRLYDVGPAERAPKQWEDMRAYGCVD